MKVNTAILILCFLFVSCDSPAPKQNGSGKTAGEDSQSPRGTGIWQNEIYTDEFGQTSDRDCIRNRDLIAGSFSNVAKTSAPLNVRFLIFNPNSISLQLFENAGNTPVKALTPQGYTVTIDDADGAEHKVKAVNYSDKVAFEKTDAGIVHEILMKGGRVQFSIAGDFNATTRYQFTIDNATGYDAAFRNLTQK
jgi:hypothetical protein